MIGQQANHIFSERFLAEWLVCLASGLTCVDVKSLAGADSNCTASQGATIFYALCK